MPPESQSSEATDNATDNAMDNETSKTPEDLTGEESEPDEGSVAEKKRSSRSRPEVEIADPVIASAPTVDVASSMPANDEPTMSAIGTVEFTVAADASPTPTPTADEFSATAPVANVETAVQQPAVSASIDSPDSVPTTSLSSAVRALFFDPSGGDAPKAPLESATMWTLVAAARREFDATTPQLEQAGDSVATSLMAGASSAAAATPAVVAIEQIAPLAWLQQVPVIGPLIVTPIVASIHQIPFVGDVLHSFVGYPVQRGLPAGSPLPRDVKVVSFDGTEIYVHFMPAVGLQAGQTAPTVLSAPGLGLAGATNLDGTPLDGIITDFVGYVGVGPLRRAGYNVVTWDPRGEWNSGGQLELNSPDFEGRDVSTIISWVADQPEAQLDASGDPRMGMVGASYGGGIQLVTAGIDDRVDAIVPSITWNSLSTTLYRNEAFRSSWGTLLSAALVLTLARMNPRIIPAAIYGDLAGQLTQADQDLLAERNPAVSNITAPTLLIQGTADTILTLEEAHENAMALIGNDVPTKVLWFCGGHGVCWNNLLDFSDGEVIERNTFAWLDRYVKQNPNAVTGPQFEWVDQRGQWFSTDEYPGAQGPPIVASSSTGGVLPLIPYLGGSGLPVIPLAFKAANALNLTVPASATTTYLVGAPELALTYSGTGTASHVYAQLVDDTNGLVLGGIVTPIPVTLDGQAHTVTVSLERVAHTLAPGETVTLQLVSSAGIYETILPSLGTLTVSSMQLTLPHR